MDARILRTRAALLDAGTALVEERDPAEISMTDIAARAGVSRQVVYDHFADRDHVLAEAAIARIRQVIRQAEDGPTQLPRDGSPPHTLTTLMTHLVDNRAFYQRLLSGRTGTVVREELTSHNRFHFERMIDLPGPTRSLSLDERAELVTFLAGGSTAVIVSWLTQDREASSPESMADRLWRLWTSLRPVTETVDW